MDYIFSFIYIIVNFYNLLVGSILYMDVYCLEIIEEFCDLGLDEYFFDVIILIEWGEKVVDDFEEYLVIDIDFVEQEKDYCFYWFLVVGE